MAEIIFENVVRIEWWLGRHMSQPHDERVKWPQINIKVCAFTFSIGLKIWIFLDLVHLKLNFCYEIIVQDTVIHENCCCNTNIAERMMPNFILIILGKRKSHIHH